VAIELSLAPDARVGLHAIGVITPLGVPSFQTFAVSADSEITEQEPNDRLALLNGDRQGAALERNDVRPEATEALPLPHGRVSKGEGEGAEVRLPATLLGTIDRPGDIDHFRFMAKSGQQLIFQVVARSLSSQLRPILTLFDARGNTLVQTRATPVAASLEPVLSYTVRADGPMTLRVADADFSGSGDHFYRIAAGEVPYVDSVFPLGVQRGTTACLEIQGANLEGIKEIPFHPRIPVASGTILEVPVEGLPSGKRPYATRTVVVADGPQVVEQEVNDTTSQARELSVPGGASGRIGHDGDIDFYRFRASKGETIVIELYGRRLGSPIDSAIEVLDAQGKPIPRAVLRPVDQTEVAFRDHPSSAPGIRLTHWDNLAINDYLLFGRELARIRELPRNPDDDCQFWPQQGQRLGWLETTPEQHPMGQPMYKVEIHPPGTVFPPSGVPATTLTYQNDDGGPSMGKDSRVTFRAPADGAYLVRVEDVRGLGGRDSYYHLVLRRLNPSFQVVLGTENPNIPRGGTLLVGVTVMRRDGFDSPLEVVAEALPMGITATPAVIDGDEQSGLLALTVDASAPAFSPPTWRIVARAIAHSATSQSSPPLQRQEIDPGGPDGGWITVTPAANLKVSARPGRVVVHPGQRVSMTLAVERAPAFSGRVPIDVRNLPQGVRVLNIGLNGVLITEKQLERTVFLLAESWVRPMTRPFYAVGKAESAGTEDSSPPIELVIVPGTQQAATKP
jgi:hypothetical protein